MLMGCVESANHMTLTDIEMLRAEDYSPDEHASSFDLINIPHPGQLLHLQSSLSFPDVSLAFRMNGRDCFFNNHEPHGNGPDHEVPAQDNTQAIQIFHHHFHHFLPARPRLVAPPLQVVPIMDKKVACDSEVLAFSSLARSTPDVKAKTAMRASSPHEQVCAHCSTGTTSLWRRVEDRLMCNACALYLKLHGSDRPLHLSTGVIKRRNRVGGSVSRRSRKH